MADGWIYGVSENKVFTANQTLNADFVIENGIPTLKQTTQTITTNNTSATAVNGTIVRYMLPAGTVAEDAANTVVNGLGKILEDSSRYNCLAFSLKQTYYGG